MPLLVLGAFAVGLVCGALWHRAWVFPFPRLHRWLHASPPGFLVQEADYYVADEVAGHVHRPHAVRELEWPEHPAGRIRIATNNLGFREDEDTLESKAGGTVRILVTGDSHVDGVVENSESFPNLLEALLSATESGARHEVINGGVGVYGPRHYLGFLRKHLGLRPDVYIVVVYAGNDLVDALSTAEREGRVRTPRRSRDYYAALEAGMARDKGLVWQALNQAFLFHRYPPLVAQALEMAQRPLLEIQRICAREAIRFIVVLLPTRLDLRVTPDPYIASLMEEVFQMTWGLGAVNLDAGRQLLRVLEDHGVETLDVLPAFRRSAGKLFWSADSHLGLEGHQVLARAVFEYLAAERR